MEGGLGVYVIEGGSWVVFVISVWGGWFVTGWEGEGAVDYVLGVL